MRFTADLHLHSRHAANSTPEMCRRIPCLDGFGLFANSDAHSPENIGQCTLLEIEPGYRELFAALRAGTTDAGVLGTIKFALERARSFRNRCTRREESFDGARCPRCGRALVMGSRDRLERIADRVTPTCRRMHRRRCSCYRSPT